MQPSMQPPAAPWATPLLYINMGGEMLYVLQQRLQTQRISPGKSIQVMNEVIEAMLQPAQLAAIFGPESPEGLSQLRPVLERVLLSSIVRLDASSTDKLFDLMTAMLKYQLTTASGPRELILATLNHLDAVRDMAVDRSLAEHADACHRLVLQTYGQMTHRQIWQMRDECLRELREHRVRVSVLLRLGLQNPDASFERLPQSYDEAYENRRQLLEDMRLMDYVDEGGSLGQLELNGQRATLLGKNAYCSGFGRAQSAGCSRGFEHAMLARSTKATRVEIQSLAAQLGQEETAPNSRPFSLHLFSDSDSDRPCKPPRPSSAEQQLGADDPCNDDAQPARSSQHSSQDLDLHQYKNDLIRHVDAQFSDNHDDTRTDTLDLINLLDIV